MIQGEKWKVLIGKNLDLLPTLEDNSVDSIVTDPPYELGFMGKKWDSTGIAYNPDLWRECLRVLKPGGHLLSFGGTRTWHRIAVAIEDAGFEVRDSIAWMYGSGFPKSLDISKAIDKQAGAERKEWPTMPMQKKGEVGEISKNRRCAVCLKAIASGNPCQCDRKETSVTPEAQQWEGWGTALKPAFEPIIVARKPLIGTVAENVLTYGTGGLNIDGSRVGNEKLGGGTMPDLRDVGRMSKEATGIDKLSFGQNPRPATRLEQPEYTGRWPANVILDEYTAGLLDEQSGITKDGIAVKRNSAGNNIFSATPKPRTTNQGFGGLGGASRFFYVAKASKRDRNEGLEELEPQRHSDREKDDGVGGDNPRNRTNQAKQNFHPTVKPTELMRYLVKLVTPPNGLVLDPFTGSGSTGKAAILEGFDFLGIEMTEDYIPIIEGRLRHAETQVKENEGLF